MDSSEPEPAVKEKTKEDAVATKDKNDEEDGEEEEEGEEEGEEEEDEEDNAEDDEFAKLVQLSPSEQEREDARKEGIKKEARRKERDEEMRRGVTLNHTAVSATYLPATLAEGVKAWTDRKHAYTGIPEDLVDAVYFPDLRYKSTQTGTFTLTFAVKGTAFIWSDVKEADGGFPALGWEPVEHLMGYAEGREHVRVWKQEVHTLDPLSIPVVEPWRGGIAFLMRADGLDTPPEISEPPEEEEPPSCLEKCCQFLLWLDPLERLDKFLTRWNPLTPLEHLLTKRHEKSLRQDVVHELRRVYEKEEKRRRRQRTGYQSSGNPEFSDKNVLEVYRRLHPRYSAHTWQRACAGQLSPRATFIELGWRFCLVVSLGLLLFLFLALGALSPQDLAVHQATGALSGPAAGDLPIATSATVRLRPIWDFPELEMQELRRLEDVIFTHNKATHVLRISRLTKMSNGTLVLHTTDGSKIRIQPDHTAFWRQQGTKSSEVELEDMQRWEMVPRTQETAWLTSGVVSEQLVMPA